MAPANTPAQIIAKLNAEINRILTMPEVRDYVSSQGATATGSTPEQLAERIKAELTTWPKIVKQSMD
jgi:tripartite-type tricarboxylate transporter receptor subunit TctC